ncbi:Proteasome assembly chaperone 2 [Trichoplax sp. H2]|nr:Proteasome assembly chaperone 2 [Trichoplax sp. H2]|eukprot:RDD44109.1 Proteasome assembly chaperone 2 [Trichoplax sp. H2]
MFIPCDSVDLPNCSQYTLILPSSSVQNVGQLAVDLLISTMDCQLIGYWHHSCLLPVVGHDTSCNQQDNKNCHNQLLTPSQVYMSRTQKYVFMQIRSPVISGGAATFCADLVKWISQKGFHRVVLATSCYIHEKINTSIGSGFRYLTSRAACELRDRLENNCSWVGLEECPSTIGNSNNGVVDQSDTVLIAGGGFAKKFFLECNKENIPLIVIISLCTEGNAIEMALRLDSHLNDWLQFLPHHQQQSSVHPEQGLLAPWIMPKSWEVLLNRHVPSDLY